MHAQTENCNRALLTTWRSFRFLPATHHSYVPLTDSLAKKRGSWGDSSTLGGFLRHFLRKGAWYMSHKVQRDAIADTADTLVRRSHQHPWCTRRLRHISPVRARHGRSLHSGAHPEVRVQHGASAASTVRAAD